MSEVKVKAKKLKNGNVSVVISLNNFYPSSLSSMASDLTSRARSVTARTIGYHLSDAVIKAFLPKEDK